MVQVSRGAGEGLPGRGCGVGKGTRAERCQVQLGGKTGAGWLGQTEAGWSRKALERSECHTG